jgi:hypothetical protein
MTDTDLHSAGGESMTPGERLDIALSGIAQVTDEIVVAYQEFDRLVSRWSLLQAVTAAPGQAAGSGESPRRGRSHAGEAVGGPS